MEIAVLGGGHGCYAAAADLADKGHDVRFWRRDAAAFAPVLASSTIALKDTEGDRNATLALATTDAGEAITGADLVVMPLPATAQAGMAPILAEHLRDGQVVYLAPGSFGSYVLAKEMRDRGNQTEITFADAGTLPYLARKHPDGSIAIATRASRLPSGVFPARLGEHAFAVLEQAYPAIERRADALDAALLNHGPMIHPPLILLNAGPIQHFDTWDIHNEGTQPFIRSVTDALEAERIGLREHLGYGAPHFPLADHYDRDIGEEPMYGQLGHERLVDSGDWREDLDLNTHRYLREDIVYGLAFLVSLARWAGVAAPVAEGLVAIAGAGVGEDLYAEGRTMAACGLADLDGDGLRRLLREGLAA
jgi:opine dehydrogenase